MEPARNDKHGIEPDIRPKLGVIDGGGETTPDRPAQGKLGIVPNLSDAEQNGTVNNPSSNVRESEAFPSNVTPINSTYGTNPTTKIPLTKQQIGKRVGIIGGAGGIVGVILFFLAGFLPIGGVLLNLGEVATANRDTQNTIFSRRLYSVLDKKLGQEVTTGVCTKAITIACRFSRPSNAFLSRLSDNGIQALNKSGDPVQKRLLGFPNEKPLYYIFNGEKIPAKDFVGKLKADPAFRKAFTSAFNMRYWGYADTFIKKLFYKKNDIDRTGKTTSSIDPEDPHESIKTLSDGAESENKVKGATTDAEKNTAIQSVLTDEITDEVERSAGKVWKAGGDPVITIGVTTCLGMNAPGVFTKIARAYQMRQEILLASTLVLTASSMLKSGEISPETMATIGGLLTATALSSDGSMKSAMDSDGMKSILFNDSPKLTGSFTKFIPGYSAVKATSGISAFANSPGMKDTCNLLYSPQAQVASGAITAGIGAATGGVGAVALAALKALGTGATMVIGVSALMEIASPLIAEGVSGIISLIGPEVMAQVLGNPDIANAKGEDLGNVLAGGMSFFFSNAALSTGAGALRTDQLAAYSKASEETMVAYAEQDRYGRSPLDVSSPYTFLGSIVSNYYKYAYVPNNVVKTVSSSIGYTLSRPFNLLSPSTYAEADDLSKRCGYAAEFGVDPSVAIAAYSDICAGVPAEFLGVSTDDVLATASSQIDEESGEPKEDGTIQEILDTCGQADLLSVSGCTITDQERANKSIYMFDLRINTVLDGEDALEPEETSYVAPADNIISVVPSNQLTVAASLEASRNPNQVGNPARRDEYSLSSAVGVWG